MKPESQVVMNTLNPNSTTKERLHGDCAVALGRLTTPSDTLPTCKSEEFGEPVFGFSIQGCELSFFRSVAGNKRFGTHRIQDVWFWVWRVAG